MGQNASQAPSWAFSATKAETLNLRLRVHRNLHSKGGDNRRRAVRTTTWRKTGIRSALPALRDRSCPELHKQIALQNTRIACTNSLDSHQNRLCAGARTFRNL